MTPDQIDRVFGCGRLKMVTGEHVEVFREAVAPGERRRYTKRFLNTTGGDFAHWTEREWRILARLIGHGIGCVPDVVQFDRGSVAGKQLVQTYDAGVTVDQWATLLPLLRNGHVYRHAFEDCAHWWALAHHCLVALHAIHQLQLVHLDIKGDNVCIPLGPASFDPYAPGLRLHPIFGQLALIDFAFALVSRETLTTPLPIGWQREYDYQSPRLLKALEAGRNGDLRPTGELDWRCDMYSLAAMLKRYLPDEGMVHESDRATGWSRERHDAARALILTLRDHHDRDAPQLHPHAQLIEATGERLREDELALSLASGWTLARDVSVAPVGASPLTPMTRLAPSIRVFVSPHDRVSTHAWAAIVALEETSPLVIPQRDDAARSQTRGARAGYAALASAALVALVAGAALAIFPDAARTTLDEARNWLAGAGWQSNSVATTGTDAKRNDESAAPGTTTERLAASAPSAPSTETEAPPTATAAPGADAGTQDTEPAERISEPVPQPQREPGDTGSIFPNRARDAAPPLAPTRPKAAPSTSAPAHAAGRGTAGKGAAIDSTPPSPTRSAKPLASVKPPIPSAPPFPAGRPETQARRGSPPPVLYSSAAPSGSTEQRPRVEQATARPAPSAPTPSETTPPQTTLALVQPPAAQPIAPSPEPVVEIPKAAPAPEARAAPAPVKPSTARAERAPAASENRRWEISFFSQLFRRADRAPIEDRNAQAPASRPAPAPRAQPAPAPLEGRVAQVNPNLNAPSTAYPIAIASAGTQSSPPTAQTAAPQGSAIRDEPPALSPPKGDKASAEPPASEPGPMAPDASRGVIPPAWNAAPRGSPPPRSMPEIPVEYPSSARAREAAFALQARRTLAQATPQIAMQVQSEVARVLWVAATAHDPRQDRVVVDAAQAVSVREDASQFAQGIDLAEAQRLNKEALQAYWIRRNIAEAFDLQLKAFGANPRDPEIAGNLAFLHLKISPLQPETARQLALHAIAFRGSRFRTGRIDDWNTYALASALTGRSVDAKNALFVTVALARDVEKNCITALNAIATYGERLREPAEAMLYRIYTQGRGFESPYCAWPPNRAVVMRSQ